MSTPTYTPEQLWAMLKDQVGDVGLASLTTQSKVEQCRAAFTPLIDGKVTINVTDPSAFLALLYAPAPDGLQPGTLLRELAADLQAGVKSADWTRVLVNGILLAKAVAP